MRSAKAGSLQGAFSSGRGSGESCALRPPQTMSFSPRHEWRQMFKEVWRGERDFFYDPNTHGLDIEKAKKLYAPYVDAIAHRDPSVQSKYLGAVEKRFGLKAKDLDSRRLDAEGDPFDEAQLQSMLALARDGLPLHGYLTRPRGSRATPRPAARTPPRPRVRPGTEDATKAHALIAAALLVAFGCGTMFVVNRNSMVLKPAPTWTLPVLFSSTLITMAPRALSRSFTPNVGTGPEPTLG